MLHFDMTAWLSVTKFLGVFFTGVFSMLPLVVDYRDKHKKINKWGRIALIGAAISTFVSGVSQVLELKKDTNDANEALVRNNRLLEQVRRVLNPVRDLSVSACVEVPLGSPDLAVVAANLKKIQDDNSSITGVERSDSGLLIRKTSLLLENAPPNLEAYKALSEVSIGMSFVQSSKSLEDLEKQFHDPEDGLNADLRVVFSSDNEKMDNVYSYRNGRLFIIVQNVESNPKYWVASGKIVAIEDLQGAWLILTLESAHGDDNKLQAIRSPFVLTDLMLRMTDGRSFLLSRAAFTATSDSVQDPQYFYRFPSSQDQFPMPKAISRTCGEGPPLNHGSP
jgi:hypothetical protein